MEAKMSVFVIIAALLSIWGVPIVSAQRLSEQDRLQQWYDQGNVWPPVWQPESSQFRAAMDLREAELMTLTGSDERWENFMQFTQSRLLPRFTKLGFSVIQTPPDIQAKLKQAVDNALPHLDSLRDEPGYAGAYITQPTKLIDVSRIKDDIHTEMKAAHEIFAGGMKLTPTVVYGVRVNRAGSALAMHYDQVRTHVISSIVHIAHEYDNNDEPWPFEIEDHNGVVHSFNLVPGQTLIYESSACLHGRRKILKGRYYASLFLHYQPSDSTIWSYTIEDVINKVPPHWRDGVTADHGARHAGQSITVDSRVSDAAPSRTASIPSPRTTTAAAKEVKSAPIVWPWPKERETFKRAMVKRELELFSLTGRDERWENFMLYTQGRMVPRFTERGFKVIQTPADVQARLKAALDRALSTGEKMRDEAPTLGSYRQVPAQLIDASDFIFDIHRQLVPLHEEWVGGIKLAPTNIYGIRVNRNGSALALHYDKIFSHVVSSIIHIDHEYYDAEKEPWPIEIEDHDGVLHQLLLEPGQMLFYESAACLHGRRKILNGKYYASVFSHYQPVDRSVWNYTIEDVKAHVPSYWDRGVLEHHGSRYAGQALTIDSRVSDGAPPRIIMGQRVANLAEYLAKDEL